MKGQADIGIAGLAVMGANLALNFESKGYTVALYNRTTGKLDEFIDRVGSDKNFHTTGSIPEFLGFLKSPRKILMMIRAGSGVDEFIQSLRPHLRPGDILIDAGNSFFKDTIRRSQELESIGVRYVGMGVSGGEEGALNVHTMHSSKIPESTRRDSILLRFWDSSTHWKMCSKKKSLHISE